MCTIETHIDVHEIKISNYKGADISEMSKQEFANVYKKVRSNHSLINCYFGNKI